MQRWFFRSNGSTLFDVAALLLSYFFFNTKHRTAVPFQMTTASSPTMETSLCRKPFAQLNLDERDDEDDNGEMPTLMSMVSGKSLKNKKKACQRRRRRSSVRFLKLSQITDENEDDADADADDDDDDEENAPESEQLGELYKRAIRMNAENRINAGNSWNLKLIENMDKLTSHENGETVNFTKASCTLDASVKIYSYRVDDVHLTSYKVLANLNRNDALEKKAKDKPSVANTLVHDDNTQECDNPDEEPSTGRKTTETLETNLGKFRWSFCFLVLHDPLPRLPARTFPN